MQGRPAWVKSLDRPLWLGVSAGLITAVLTLFVQNSYTSQASILPTIGSQTGPGGIAAAAASVIGMNISGGNSQDQNFQDILESRWLRE